MADKLKEIQAKVLDWWNKFTSRQKTIIIGIAAVVVFTFAILIYIFTKPQYTKLITCENTADAAAVIEILDGASISHQESGDGLVIKVQSKQLSDANLALGSAGYAPDDWTLEDVFSGGISSTAADVQKKYKLYLEKKLEKDLAGYKSIKSAKVFLNIPDQDGTLIMKTVESSAYVQLELDGEFTKENATGLAKALATALHNETTANIVIMDTNANLLFSGEEDYTTAGIASSMMELRNQAETMVASQVKKVLLGTNQFDMVEVACGLDIDYTSYERTINSYSPAEGQDTGMISHQEIYDEESENGVTTGGTPGTDSNDETTNLYQDGNGSSSSSKSETVTDYQNDNTLEHSTTPAGGVDFTNSSISITGITYRAIREEDAKNQGLLDGISWEEYKSANDGLKTKLEVDPDFYSIVSNATRIGEDNITIVAYEEIVCFDSEGMNISWTDILSVAMLVIILGLLAFVVLRSMRSKRVAQEEEELSVEKLLQSTPEEELEDIDPEGKSETRKMIEKFVDDNPEAAANLLRNWLTEDWG